VTASKSSGVGPFLKDRKLVEINPGSGDLIQGDFRIAPLYLDLDLLLW
jgi:hypothetical protein